jgi:hypothetical protein
MNYKHSKPGNSSKGKTRRDGSVVTPKSLRAKEIRKAENHETVERVFGEFFPEFGSSLGVSYDKDTGDVTKAGRTPSIKSFVPSAGPADIVWSIQSPFSNTDVIIAYAYNGAYLFITPTGTEYTISSVFPTDWTNVVDPDNVFTAAPPPNTPADIAIISGTLSNPRPVSFGFLDAPTPIQTQNFAGIPWVSADINHLFFVTPLSSDTAADYTRLFSLGTHNLVIQ